MLRPLTSTWTRAAVAGLAVVVFARADVVAAVCDELTALRAEVVSVEDRLLVLLDQEQALRPDQAAPAGEMGRFVRAMIRAMQGKVLGKVLDTRLRLSHHAVHFVNAAARQDPPGRGVSLRWTWVTVSGRAVACTESCLPVPAWLPLGRTSPI